MLLRARWPWQGLLLASSIWNDWILFSWLLNRSRKWNRLDWSLQSGNGPITRAPPSYFRITSNVTKTESETYKIVWKKWRGRHIHITRKPRWLWANNYTLPLLGKHIKRTSSNRRRNRSFRGDTENNQPNSSEWSNLLCWKRWRGWEGGKPRYLFWRNLLVRWRWRSWAGSPSKPGQALLLSFPNRNGNDFKETNWSHYVPLP